MTDSPQPVPPSAEFIAQVTRAQRTLHAFILSMVRNAAAADDVLQETNIVLWRKAAEFDAAREFMPCAMRAARRHYRQFMALHAGLMWDYAAAATSVEAAPVRRWRSAWALAAMLAVIATLAILWLQKPRAQDIAQLEAATGAVSWSDDSGAQRPGLAAVARLAEGTLLVEGETGSAQLRFADGTLLTLTGEAELGFSDAGQKRLNLRRGTLNAQVQPQPANRPLLIRTATAELEVLGTSFSLAADPVQTALTVETGNVRLRRLSDGQSVEVKAQHAAIASLDSRTQLRSEQPAAPANIWRRTFDTPPPASSKGEWLAASDGMPARVGSGISDGDSHNYADLEVLLAGGAMKRGHFHYEGQRPLADLWLTLAQTARVKRERFADSTGTLKEILT